MGGAFLTFTGAQHAAGGGDVGAAWLTALTALAVAVSGLLIWTARHLWRFGTRVLRFLDDYNGEPARPGVASRPGVMARLQAVETAAAKAEAAAARAEMQAAKVLAETQPNGGHSLRDVVHRTARDVADMKADQAAMRRRLEQFERQRQERDDHA